MPNTNFEVRAEGRYDRSDGDNFVDDAQTFAASEGAAGIKSSGWSPAWRP
jgi:hypothetical protein